MKQLSVTVSLYQSLSIITITIIIIDSKLSFVNIQTRFPNAKHKIYKSSLK